MKGKLMFIGKYFPRIPTLVFVERAVLIRICLLCYWLISPRHHIIVYFLSLSRLSERTTWHSSNKSPPTLTVNQTPLISSPIPSFPKIKELWSHGSVPLWLMWVTPMTAACMRPLWARHAGVCRLSGHIMSLLTALVARGTHIYKTHTEQHGKQEATYIYRRNSTHSWK